MLKNKIMKYYELTNEEEDVSKAVENDEFISRPKSEMARFESIAKSTLDKTKNINIRLSLRDFMKLKTKAIEKGMPYQTLVASILHQYSDKESV
jgi:predicted DNA binding CopG/RHH family protein